MNINDLTLGQVKELQAMLFSSNSKSSIHSRNIGRYVIVRSRIEGINAGYVVEADETGIVLKDARRLHYHKPADKDLAWYEGVAISGLGDGCRVSPCPDEKVIVEDYSITVCTEAAKKSIEGYKAYGQDN